MSMIGQEATESFPYDGIDDVGRKFVWRWVVTHIGRDGTRRMTDDLQGRYTRATKEEAEERARDIVASNRDGVVVDVFGPQAEGTFEARKVHCYPGHFDPMSAFFEE